MKNKRIAVILSCIFIAAFILWANGCDSRAVGCDNVKLRRQLEKRTGQDLSDWEELELIELEKELDKLEKEKKKAAQAAQATETPQSEQGLEATQSQSAQEAYYEDQATSEEKTTEEIQSSSNLPCQEIMGTWDGEMKMSRLTGTTTWTQHGESETYDVNELWGWWLEEPPDPLNILIWTENDQCFAKMFDYDADLTFQNGKIEWISVGDLQGLPITYLFKGSLARPGMLQGTYEMPNPLGDEGAMIYGDWSVSKTK